MIDTLVGRDREAWTRFGLGEPRGVSALESGHQSDNLRVRAASGDFVLKRWVETHAARVEAVMEVQRVVCECGLPAPTPMPAASGGFAVCEGGVVYSVARFLPGAPLPYLRVAPALHSLGRWLGRLHAALVSIDLDPRTSRVGALGRSAIELAETEWSALVPPDDTDARQRLDRWRAELASFRSESLTCGVVHGDVGPFSFFFERGALTAIIDFGAAQPAPLLFDVGTFVMYTDLAAPARSADLERFLDGYSDTTPVAAGELEHLLFMVRTRWIVQLAYFAMRITSGRLQGVASPGENHEGYADAKRALALLDE